MMYWFGGIVIAAFLGLIPANIAKRKGYEFWVWYIYGWMLFIVAIIHVSLIPDKNTEVKVVPSSGAVVRERSSVLPSGSERQYAQGSPVLIEKKELLKGDQTKQIQAKIRMKSISDKPIKAVTVQITPFDTAGRPLGEPVIHHYLDFIAERDGVFGEKELVLLPDILTREFSVAVTEVIFTDNSIWNDSGEP